MDIKIASLTSFRLLDKMYNINEFKGDISIVPRGHSTDFFSYAGEYLTADEFYGILRSCCDSYDDENFNFTTLESTQKMVIKFLATIAQSEDVKLLVADDVKNEVLRILNKVKVPITKTAKEPSETNFRRIYLKKKLSGFNATEINIPDTTSKTSITIGKKTISVRDAVENAQPAPKIGISKTKFTFNFE